MNQSGRETERRSPAFNGREGIALSELTGGLILFERIFGSDSILVIITAVVLFAPFAAYLSWRSSNSKKFAIYGAVYSLLMLMPGIWLVLKLQGSSIPKLLIVVAFSFVYIVWLVYLVLVLFFAGLIVVNTDHDFFDTDPAIQGWLLIATSVASGFVWLKSVRRTSKLREATSDNILDFARVEPFGFVMVNTMTFFTTAITIAILTGDDLGGTVVPYWVAAVLAVGWMLARIPYFVREEIRDRTIEREENIARHVASVEANRRHRW